MSEKPHKKNEVPHHFDSRRQQVESNRLGMWLFLSTEIMMFGGLFCGYAVYRTNHPEIFIYAHQFLDKTMGGLNTLILICSSLTMAWAVRCAQLGERKKLVPLLLITALLACGFMCIKGVEYNQKWKHGLLWGKRYHHVEQSETGAAAHEGTNSTGQATAAPGETTAAATPPGETTGSGVAATATEQVQAMNPYDELIRIRSNLPPPGHPPAGLAAKTDITAHHMDAPKNVHIFFGIYFVMTGLHGLHVLIGICLIIWLAIRASKGEFGPDYFSPVDSVGLYWHLVDLIWIYLFPLLYLIH